jgi:hypothetical protein
MRQSLNPATCRRGADLNSSGKITGLTGLAHSEIRRPIYAVKQSTKRVFGKARRYAAAPYLDRPNRENRAFMEPKLKNPRFGGASRSVRSR